MDIRWYRLIWQFDLQNQPVVQWAEVTRSAVLAAPSSVWNIRWWVGRGGSSKRWRRHTISHEYWLYHRWYRSHGFIIHKPKAKHEMMLGPLAAGGLISDHPACASPKAEEKKQKKLLGDSQRYPMHSHRCGKPMGFPFGNISRSGGFFTSMLV